MIKPLQIFNDANQRPGAAQRWWNFASYEQDGKAALYLYGDIVSNKWFDEDVTPLEVVDQLKSLAPDTHIDVHIDSLGGLINAGIAIYETLNQHQGTVHAYVDGVAASIASIIIMGADKVFIGIGGRVMVHNPWTVAAGDSVQLRKTAEELDNARDVLVNIYMTKVSLKRDEITALMDAETWMTHEQAIALGFADELTSKAAVAAHGDPSKFEFLNIPSQLVKQLEAQKVLNSAKDPNSGGASPPVQPATTTAVVEPPQANVLEIENAAKAKALAADKERRAGIRAAMAAFPQLGELSQECQDDSACTVEAARGRALAALGENTAPANPGPSNSPHIMPGVDSWDKFRAGVTQTIVARAQRKYGEGDNNFRHMGFKDIAKNCLQNIGHQNVYALSPMQLYAAALTTSDFTNILEDSMTKMLLDAYAVTPDTWSKWCKTGEVSDFKASARHRMGSFSRLLAVNEHGEYRQGQVPDSERETVTADSLGREIMITRKTLVNDDMGALNDMSVQMGRAAARSIEADAYAALAANAAMSDAVALFHADHNNIIAGAGAPSSANVEAAYTIMRNQTIPSSSATDVDYADISPAVLLVPTADRGAAIKSMEAEFSNFNKGEPNAVRNLAEVVDTPRITAGTFWYLVASPMDAPLMEVAFLDGVQEPFLETTESANPDGVKWLVRLDYGVAPIDYRGGVRHVRS